MWVTPHAPWKGIAKLEKELSIFQHLLKRRFYWILTQNLKGRDYSRQCRLLAPVLAPSEAQVRTGAQYGGGLLTATR